MELIVDEKKMKALLKDSLIEMMKDKEGVFHKMVIESIEDGGLANAIKAGRKNKFIDEGTRKRVLKSRSK